MPCNLNNFIKCGAGNPVLFATFSSAPPEVSKGVHCSEAAVFTATSEQWTPFETLEPSSMIVKRLADFSARKIGP